MDRELRRRVAAVVPVHLYGQPADMDAILDIAERYGLIVIEDACQAHGAEYFSEKIVVGKRQAPWGWQRPSASIPGKTSGACGEGGAVTTNDPAIARKIRMLRDHGQAQKYYHDLEGYNGRLDAIQAGILGVKLRRLPVWNEERRKAAECYHDLLGNVESVGIPDEPKWSKAVYHLYVVRVEHRDELLKHLAAAKIGTGIHYPVPLHLQVAYRDLGYTSGDFPVTERAAAEVLSLPMFPGIGEAEQRWVVEEVRAFGAAHRHLAASAAHA